MTRSQGPFEKLVESTLAKGEAAPLAEGMSDDRWKRLLKRIKEGRRFIYQGKKFMYPAVSGTGKILTFHERGKPEIRVTQADVNDYSLDKDGNVVLT